MFVAQVLQKLAFGNLQYDLEINWKKNWYLRGKKKLKFGFIHPYFQPSNEAGLFLSMQFYYGFTILTINDHSLSDTLYQLP